MTAVAENIKITFQKEFFYYCMAELPPLFMAEWHETIGDSPSKQELSPAWEKYVQMELAGTLFMLTARAGKNLVGYIISVLHPHLHFSKTIYAFIDAFYLRTEFRDGENEQEFIKYNEQLLAEQGAKRVNAAIPASMWQYRLFKKLQYQHTEAIMAKWLKGA